MISEPARRSYGENENLTLSDADLAALGEPKPTAGGRKLRAYCPIHGSDHQRSLEVSLDIGRFHCHACDAWGYLDWAREEYARERGLEREGGAGGSSRIRRGGSRKPPVRRPPAPTPKPPEPVREDLSELMERFREALPGSWGEKYLEHRGIPLELAREYGIGYAAPEAWPGRKWKGGRLVAPHTRPDGTIVNLYGRAVAKGEIPKQCKHDHLFGNKGYWNARILWEGSGPLYVCEGLLDALALIASGCERTAAIFSARDWRWHWLPDDACKLVLAFDADTTGDEAREKLASEARLRGIEVAYLDQDSYGGENDPAAAYAAGKLEVGEWPEPPADKPEVDPQGSTLAEAAETPARFLEPPKPEHVDQADPGGTTAETISTDQEASRLLYALYERGLHLELRDDGHLYAGPRRAPTDADREGLREHGEMLKYMLSEEAMKEMWPRAIRHIADTARGSGYTAESAEYRCTAELIEKAQNAYERGEDGLTRYRLRQAELAAAGRLTSKPGM